MELTFRVRYYGQDLIETYYTLFTIYITHIYACGPVLLETYLRRDTRPCQSLDNIVGVNIEIAAEQICFSAMKPTSHNTVN